MLYQLSYLGAAGAGELRRSGGYRGTALPLSSGCWGKRRKERRWNDDGGWKRALGFTVPGIGTRTAFEGRSACLANDRRIKCRFHFDGRDFDCRRHIWRDGASKSQRQKESQIAVRSLMAKCISWPPVPHDVARCVA